MFKPKKTTVLCNECPGTLNIALPLITGGHRVTLNQTSRKYIDVEDAVGDQDKLKALIPDFERLTEMGYVSWHPKGSKPEPHFKPYFKLPMRGETVIAPANEFDDKLIELGEKEKRDDERSKQGSAAGPTSRAGTVDDVTYTGNDAVSARKSTTAATAEPNPSAQAESLLRAAVDGGKVDRRGPYYYFGDTNLGKSADKAITFLSENEDTFNALKESLED